MDSMGGRNAGKGGRAAQLGGAALAAVAVALMVLYMWRRMAIIENKFEDSTSAFLVGDGRDYNCWSAGDRKFDGFWGVDNLATVSLENGCNLELEGLEIEELHVKSGSEFKLHDVTISKRVRVEDLVLDSDAVTGKFSLELDGKSQVDWSDREIHNLRVGWQAKAKLTRVRITGDEHEIRGELVCDECEFAPTDRAKLRAYERAVVVLRRTPVDRLEVYAETPGFAIAQRGESLSAALDRAREMKQLAAGSEAPSPLPARHPETPFAVHSVACAGLEPCLAELTVATIDVVMKTGDDGRVAEVEGTYPQTECFQNALHAKGVAAHGYTHGTLYCRGGKHNRDGAPVIEPLEGVFIADGAPQPSPEWLRLKREKEEEARMEE